MAIDRLADWLLRGGLAFAFLYPPIDAMFTPDTWIGYFPSFLLGIVPDFVLLHVFGLLEIIIAVWILSGWKIFFPSLVAACMLLAIVIFNHANFEVLFRDLSIACLAFGVALLNRPLAAHEQQ